MNIFSREMKAKVKVFLFWCLGMFVLIYAGIIKSTGFSGDEADLMSLLTSFPKIVLAVIGVTDMDMSTFDGFYAVMANFAIILVSIYAVHLGNNAVSAESVDKTYEFVFTKPRSRSYILTMKLLAGLLALTAFCVMQFCLSCAAASTLTLPQDYTWLFALFSLASWLVGLFFFGMGALFAATAHSCEKGARRGNNLVLILYCMGIVYAMLEGAPFLRWLSPFKYFLNTELIGYHLNGWFAILCVAMTSLSLAITYLRFEKKDLNAA